MSNNFLASATELLPEMVEWRRHIHHNAELSFKEFGTQEFVCSILDRYEIPYRRVAGTGVVAVVDGAEPDSLRPIVLRADMDALPIVESTGLPFASTSGAMHACGHDMHTASLLGALVMLRRRCADFRGTVWGLFQPGEEMFPGGASVVLSEGVFEGVNPRAFVGGHVTPELEMGQIGMHDGLFLASSDEIHITVTGRGGHGAQPHLLCDPVLASSAIVMALQQIVSRNSNPLTPSVLSFGRFVANGATNIIPERVELSGTLRTMDDKWRVEALDRVRQVAGSVAEAYGAEACVNIRRGYPAVSNNLELAAIGRRVVGDIFPEGALVEVPRRMTSEDFGFYSERYPSLFFRWGVASVSPLHTGTFSPSEEALAFGASMLAAMALYINSFSDGE